MTMERIWAAKVEGNIEDVILTGFISEDRAWRVAALLRDAMRADGFDVEIEGVEPDWRYLPDRSADVESAPPPEEADGAVGV